MAQQVAGNQLFPSSSSSPSITPRKATAADAARPAGSQATTSSGSGSRRVSNAKANAVNFAAQAKAAMASLIVASGTVAPVASGALGTPPSLTHSAKPTGVNMTAITQKQKGEQFALDAAMPNYVVIALGALMVLLVIMAHPRFLVRFFASVHRRRTARAEEAARPTYAFNMHRNVAEAQIIEGPRVVSGGDLTKGWVMSSGRLGAPVGSSASLGTSQDHFAASTTDVSAVVKCKRSPLAPPPHIAPFSARLPLHRVLDWAPFARLPHPFCTGADLKTLIVVAVYIAICCFACIYKSDVRNPTKNSGFGSDYSRTGAVAMTQVPVAIALGVRGNLPGLLVAKSYNHLRIFHKIAGRLMFLGALLHSAFFLYKWNSIGKLAQKSASPIGVTGLIATAGTCVIFVTSLPVVRRYAYNFFKVSHYIGIVMLLGGLGAHVEEAVPWVVASAAIYGISIITSFVKSRVTSAELVALSGCTTTVITIPSLTTGWRPGQHVRLRVFGLGLVNSFEAHPFTIASAPDCGGMVLLAKAAGNWTEKLYKYAASGGNISGDTEIGAWSRKAKVHVEGPYGGTGNTLPPSFSSICLVAGGSGISHAIGMAQDLIARSPSGVVAARTIDIVWVVRAQQTARAIMPTLTALVEQARSWETKALKMRKQREDISLPTALRVHIFVTRLPDSSPLTLVDEKRMDRWQRMSQMFPTDVGSPTEKDGMYDEEIDSSDDSHGWSNHGHSEMDHGIYLAPPRRSDGNGNPYAMGHALGKTDTNNTWRSSMIIAQREQGSASVADVTAAERTRADWLDRHPSNAAVARLRERVVMANTPMSALSAYRGRPDLPAIITGLAEETHQRHGHWGTRPSGVFVTCCGPEFLVNDTRDASRNITSWVASHAGGVEFEAEFFGV